MSPEGVVAAGVTGVLAAAGVALAFPPGPGSLRRTPRGRRTGGGRGTALTLGAGVGLLIVAGLRGTHLALLLIGVGAAFAGLHLAHRQRQRREAEATSIRVQGLCELLAEELRAGQPPERSLDRAAEQWPELGPAATASRFAADVPEALRALAVRPGAGDLLLVAGAWQVAQRSGAGLADSVGRVAVTIRRNQSTRRVVAAELASARATSRLMAALPVLALAMGSGIGGNPWGFLLSTPIGLCCLAAGLVMGFAGLLWIEAIADAVLDP